MQTRNISRSALCVLVLMAAFPVASSADSIVFNDFGTGHNYNAKTGLAIGGKNSNPGFVEWGEAFVPKAKFDLSAITMALGSITGSNGVRVSLDASTGGAPGKTLASWSFLALPQAGTTSSTVQTMTFADAIVLQKNQTYWLVTAPLAANTQAVWNLTSTGVTGLGAVNFGGVWLTADVPSGAFEVVGKSVVPEPAMWLLFATGLLGIMSAIRTDRRGKTYCGTR
jgi:hypothetical protein